MKERMKSPPPTQSIKVQYIVQLRTNYLASIFSSSIGGGSIQIVVLQYCLVSQKCSKIIQKSRICKLFVGCCCMRFYYLGLTKIFSLTRRKLTTFSKLPKTLFVLVLCCNNPMAMFQFASFQLDLYTFECPCSEQIIDRYFYYLSRVEKKIVICIFIRSCIAVRHTQYIFLSTSVYYE